ncbi:MAG: chromosomal replication initiator protein DnaA [Clostridia bacterium]|nr:chromosomal replication initiator protein DnaA [Clostridia bacterium]
MNYTPEDKAKWDRVMEMLEETLRNSGQLPAYNAFIKPLKLYAATSDTLYISGDSIFNLNHMKGRYGTMIYATVPLVFGRRFELEYYPENIISQMVSRQEQATTLNEKYTFDNFIIGQSNRFAYATSLAVAQTPGEAYNPLFIYGGVGLGKTHLMNAIGNYICHNHPGLNVLLMTSEAMTNELIEGIARKKTSELRGKLRNADVLMVDDVQFLSRTKATQEEFFHTFNSLHGNKKQIIIASDRPPRELPEIEERLRSRFEWGVTVDIQKPDYETRVAILIQKAEEMNITVPYDVVEYIAQSVNSNIRELEGCLSNLNAQAELLNTPISLEMARTALAGRIVAQAARVVTADLIIEIVARQHGLTPGDITGKNRSQTIALPRQIGMYLCRRMTSMSTTNIGKAFGGRDHTTVMHACDKISEAMDSDFAFKKKVEEIMGYIENN